MANGTPFEILNRVEADVENYVQDDDPRLSDSRDPNEHGDDAHSEDYVKEWEDWGSTLRVNNSLGVGVAPSTTDGRIDALDDIIAYSSDKRLKTNIKNIKNPIEKINQIKGFTFNWNDFANKLTGFKKDVSQVGLFAQEVKKILPEAVKLAPFDNNGEDNSISGENYLTVQYEKLTPLLVEGIKEQNTIIENQNDKINSQQKQIQKLEGKIIELYSLFDSIKDKKQ